MDPLQKKEEFQRYLEKSGVVDALTKVLVGLYEVPDKPVNPIDFIKEYLGAAMSVDSEKLRAQIETLTKSSFEKDEEISRLKQQIELLQSKDTSH